jgi:diacylglycerol kinase family enzyme
MNNRRLIAIGSLLLLAAAIVLAVVTAAQHFPRGLIVFALLALAAGAAVWGLLRGGAARALGVTVAALLLVGALLLLILEHDVLADIAILVLFGLSLAAAGRVFAVRAELPRAPRPQHAVLFYNPKSGGGKAEKFKVADEAKARGVEPIQLHLGEDLEQLVRDAIKRGADTVGMAGGDGSQAIVASVAAEQGLPYVCVPAGTRNHFALDLGVDRDDVVGALDAYVDGRERVVDLAEVNGRVFVNNVSLGVYAEAVQSDAYRDAKLRTLADTVPAVLGPRGEGLDLHWTGPDGGEQTTNAVVLVSNDPYRLGRAIGSGTRPRLDAGVLGIAVVGSSDESGASTKRVEQWSAPAFEVKSERPIAAGIDGEAATLDPPLRFTTRPAALHVHIAPQHPGASPSASMPEDLWSGFQAVARVAFRGS